MFSNQAPGATRTVVVLGASYGGYRAAQVVAAGLPDGWRVVLIDRNTHANHLYILPRLGVLPGHEHKAFIPYTNAFPPPNPARHLVLHARITSLSPHALTLARAFPEHGIPDATISFDYAIYALGSHLPAPIDLWRDPGPDPGCAKEGEGEREGCVYAGTKEEGVAWLKRHQRRVEHAQSVLVVGGGALGIQYASDIAAVHPAKRVTLLHSRHRLLPRFDAEMHTEILQALEELNVHVILGERLDLASVHSHSHGNENEKRTSVRTQTGRQIDADLVMLCTGQTPNTALLRAMDPATVDGATALARVARTLQLAAPYPRPPPTPTPQTQSPDPQTPAPERAWAREGDAGVDVGEVEEALGQLALEPGNLAQHRGSPSPGSGSDSGSGSSPYVPCAPSNATEPAGDGYSEGEGEERMYTPYPHMFAIGDAADAFGALKAGHNAYFQGEVAGRNVLRLVRRDERRRDGQPGMGYSDERPGEGRSDGRRGMGHSDVPEACASDPDLGAGGGGEEGEGEEEELEEYAPNAPAIKVSLGLTKSAYQINGVVGVKHDGEDDLGARAIWGYYGMGEVDEAGMYA